MTNLRHMLSDQRKVWFAALPPDEQDRYNRYPRAYGRVEGGRIRVFCPFCEQNHFHTLTADPDVFLELRWSDCKGRKGSYIAQRRAYLVIPEPGVDLGELIRAVLEDACSAN